MSGVIMAKKGRNAGEKMKTKVVDTREYVSVLKDLVDEGRTVSLLIAGNSMSPFLVHERDYIFFKKPEKPLKKGDMVFFQRDTGEYVMHRIYRVKNKKYYIVGDAQTIIEGPVREEQIFAKIISVKRKNKQIGPGNFWWEFFEHFWINVIPLRKTIISAYSFCKKFVYKGHETSVR